MTNPEEETPARKASPLFVKLGPPLRQDQLTPEQGRRLRGKRQNDAIRTTASFVNLIAVGSVVSGGIVPALVTGRFSLGPFMVLLVVAIMLHIFATLINRLIVSED